MIIQVILSIFHLLYPVDCEWNEWQIGECSVTCGEGTRYKIRTKKVKEENGGTCEGETTALAPCTEEDCPGNLPISNELYVNCTIKV